jgi:predicted TIM-barrel fold metal-dependent hydrolase
MNRMIDIYGHIGLPRFTTAESFLRLMDQHGVEQALLSTAQFCPDLFALARAVSLAPHRFRALGLPLGPGRAEIRLSVDAQLRAGFSGIRIMAKAAQEDPELLEIIGRHGKLALVVAFESWAPYAEQLADFLDRYPRSLIIGGHFAGPSDPALLDRGGSMAKLFDHERFVVAFTRQGLMDPTVLLPWARALVERLGWRRMLWGSEWPVALWRDESYADTMRFVDQFQPTAAERELFFHENARRLIFSHEGSRAIAADASFDLMPYKVPSVIQLFPNALQVPEPLHQQVMQAYLDDPRYGSWRYSDFVQWLLERGLKTAAGGGGK